MPLTEKTKEAIRNSGNVELMNKYDIKPNEIVSPNSKDIIKHESKKHIDFNAYMENPYFANNINIFFQDEKNRNVDITQFIDYRSKIKNIANMSYAGVINDMFKENNKKHNEITKSWTKLHNDTRELLKLFTHLKFERTKDKGIQLAEDGVDLDYYKNAEQVNKDLNRVSELTQEWATNWSNAERSLTQILNENGEWEQRPDDAITLKYDDVNDKLTTLTDYDITHSDIFTDETAYTTQGQKAFGALNRVLTAMYSTTKEEDTAVKDFMHTWFNRSLNSFSKNDENLNKFNGEREWRDNQDFVDTFVRSIINDGIDIEGFANYKTEDLIALRTSYQEAADAGFNQDKGYHNTILWLENHMKELHDMVDNLSEPMLDHYYQKYQTRGLGLGKYTNPIKKNKFNDQAPKDEITKFANYKNKVDNFLESRSRMRSTSQAMWKYAFKESINKDLKSLNLGSDAKTRMYRNRDGGEHNETSRFIVETLQPFYASFGIDMNGNLRTTDELIDFIALWQTEGGAGTKAQWLPNTYNEFIETNASRAQAWTEFQSHKIDTYDKPKSGEIGFKNAFYKLSPEEKRKQNEKWYKEYSSIWDSVVMLNLDTREGTKDKKIIVPNNVGDYVEMSTFEYQEKMGAPTMLINTLTAFRDVAVNAFDNIDPANIFVNASTVAGHKMSGNYAQGFKGVTFKESTNPVQNRKNMNSIKMFTGIKNALAEDLNLIEDKKENLHYEAEPNVVIMAGQFKHDFDPSDTDEVNDYVRGDYDWGAWLTFGGTSEKESEERIMPLNTETQSIINNILENKDNNLYEIMYYNNTGHPGYKAYGIYPQNNKLETNRNNGYTVYIKTDKVRNTGEGFVNAEYNDSDDYVFDLKGEFTLGGEFSEYAGRNLSDGSYRITRPTIVSRNGLKYLRYEENNELDPATSKGTQYYYLGDSEMTIDNAREKVKDIMTNYNNVNTIRAKNPKADLRTIILNQRL